MAIIKLKTEGQALKSDGVFPVITSGDKKIDSVQITLDDLWLDESEGVISYYFVIWLDEAETQEKLMTKDGKEVSADIPNEFLTVPQVVSFGIYAKNANGETLITSSVINFKIEKGTPTNNEPVIDWQAFKSEIITIMNERFATDLPESADTAAILAALSSVEMTSAALAELIEVINIKFEAALPESATVADIKTFISDYPLFDEQPLLNDWYTLYTGGYIDAE